MFHTYRVYYTVSTGDSQSQIILNRSHQLSNGGGGGGGEKGRGIQILVFFYSVEIKDEM